MNDEPHHEAGRTDYTPSRRDRLSMFVCGCAISALLLSVPAYFVLNFVSGIFSHERHLDEIGQLFEHYSESDWKNLLEACDSMNARTNGIYSRVDYTGFVKKLQPFYMAVSESEITIQWTGGFDDARQLKVTYLLNDNSEREAGLWLYNSRAAVQERLVFAASRIGSDVHPAEHDLKLPRSGGTQN